MLIELSFVSNGHMMWVFDVVKLSAHSVFEYSGDESPAKTLDENYWLVV